MVAAMNSGIRVRESIRFYDLAIDARGRSAEGRSMDRDPWDAEEESRKHISRAMAGHVPSGLPMKQTRRALRGFRLDTRLRPKRTTTTAR
jgi:hypothetical protein